ncbi:hypothetical protein [Labrys neptuniae]
MTIDIEHLSFDELTDLRDRIVSKIEQIKAVEIENFRKETTEKAKKLGIPDPFSIQPKTKTRQSNPQTPPEGAQVWNNPEKPGQQWWVGKRGKRPAWAHG